MLFRPDSYLIKKQIKFRKAYLFGSFAKSNETLFSDFDIALIFDNDQIPHRFDLQVQFLTLASYIDNRIEPHPINADDFNNDNPFASEILRTGKEIEIKNNIELIRKPKDVDFTVQSEEELKDFRELMGV